MFSKKEQNEIKDIKDTNTKEEQNKNLTSSPPIQKDSSKKNNLSPEKNLNQKFFPSKENYFGMKASPPRGGGRPVSPGAHSPILNYYNVSPEVNELYYSPKENNNMNNNTSNKISPLNFNNFSPSNFFNKPKNSNQNKDSSINNLSNYEEDSKTLQEKMEPLVNNINNYNNNFPVRKGSFPSNNSNFQENKNDDEEEDENDEELFTLMIDSYDEDFVFGNNKNKNNQQGGSNEQNKKNNLIKTNENNNNNIKNNNEKEKNEDKEKKDDNIPEKKIHTIYNNIQKANDNININDEINNNIFDQNINNINNPINNQLNINQKINEQPKQEKSLVQNIINKQEFKPFIPNKFRNQFPEQNTPNNYFNAINMNMNPNINNNYIPDVNLINAYNQIESQNFFNNMNNNLNNMNNNFINNMNSMNNYNYYMSNQNLFKNIQNPNISNYQDNINRFNNIPQIMQNNIYQEQDNKNYNQFYYNGDKYQISTSKEYKKNETGEIRSISAEDIVTAITVNNKIIKRIDPNTYLNESLEYLSYNIHPLARDQAGCRFLQEKLEKDPRAAESFYKAILPYITSLVKDPFGNYLVQKLCNYLDEEKIKNIIQILSPDILDIGSNSHGTRVIQHLVNFLKNKDLVDFFLNVLRPHVIPLLKELNGTHIINKFITEHPECAGQINNIIVTNSSALATHRHGCCILQRLLDGNDKKLKDDLIQNLIQNFFVLITDQFGNYVIQSILLSNDLKSSGAIAIKICNNLPYYSKHRYSSNVIEKCFDYCGKREKKMLVEKICSPEIIADLITDEHGNYVVQKALFYADSKEKEYILNNIVMLVPKIKTLPFGEKLLNRLVINYPQLNSNIYNNNNNLSEYMKNLSLDNNQNQKNKKKKFKKKKKNDNNINSNNENNPNNNIFFNKPNPFINNNNNFLNNNINVNNNITINNFNNNNPINLNPNQNNDNIPINYMNFNNNYFNNDFGQNRNYNNINENDPENKKKKKKKKKNKNKKYDNESDNQYDNNQMGEINNNQINEGNNLGYNIFNKNE